MTDSLQERIEALEQAETFSETRRAMMALVEGGEIEALDAVLPPLLRTASENLLFHVGRKALARWDEAVLSRIHFDAISDEDEKENALYLCLWDGSDLAQAMLCEAAGDQSPSVRALATRLLGGVDDPIPAVFGTLKRAALEDGDEHVRKAAARALAAGSDPRAVHVLETLLTRGNDERVENLLVDLRLRVIERLHPGLIPPRERDQSNGAPAGDARAGATGPIGAACHRLRRSIRGIPGSVASLLPGGLAGCWRGGRAFARVGICLIISVILAYAVLNLRGAVNDTNPRPERTVYVCPECGHSETGVLRPSARCSQCGRPVFADREPGTPVIAATLDRPGTADW